MYVKNKLSNGLRIIYEKIPHVKSIVMGVWIGAGSRVETAENNGISHFIEHMLFKGTKNRTAADIAEQMDFSGGIINAFTSKECTCFYTKVTYDKLRLSADILSDMYKNSLLSDKDIDLERKVILEEINMYEDSPEDLVLDTAAEISWQGSLGFNIIGTRKNVQRFKSKDLKDYMSKYYSAENTVISVAGNFDEKELTEVLEEFFGDIANRNTKTEFEKAIFVPSNTVKIKNIEQSHLALAYKSLSQNDNDIYALSLLNNVFGGGMSSRLFQNIREKRGLAYSVYSFQEALKDAGMFVIYAATSPENTDKVKELILEEITALKEKEIGDYEFEKGRGQLLGTYLLGLESVSSAMTAMGKNELLYGRVKTPEEITESIKNITKKDIKRVIERVFTQFSEALVTVKEK